MTDAGDGVDARPSAQAFEPFFTTKAKGTGLGLPTVAAGISVRTHGGHIVLKSEVNCGTTFTVYLPQTDDLREPAARSRPRGGWQE